MELDNKVVLDSSILVAFYIKTDSQHEKAEIILSEIADENLLIHPYVIQETVTVITYKSGFRLLINFCKICN